MGTIRRSLLKVSSVQPNGIANCRRIHHDPPGRNNRVSQLSDLELSSYVKKRKSKESLRDRRVF